MEKFQELREVAQKKLKIADHMLTMTYPFVQDPKLLVAVVQNLFLALSNAMGSVLYYERVFKRIPAFQETFTSKLAMFQEKCIEKYNVSKEYITLMQNLRDIILAHRESPVEFSKKDKFVICSDDYQMKTITLPDIKEYVKKTKLFIQKTNSIISKNESIFN